MVDVLSVLGDAITDMGKGVNRMNDQISRQKLIEELEDMLSTMVADENGLHEVSLEAVIDFIIMFPSQSPADQWIPCSSGKMPEHNQRVFTTHKLYQDRLFTSAAFYLKKKDRVLGVDWRGEGFYQYSDGDYILRDDVIAWMPAEPYKED